VHGVRLDLTTVVQPQQRVEQARVGQVDLGSLDRAPSHVHLPGLEHGGHEGVSGASPLPEEVGSQVMQSAAVNPASLAGFGSRPAHP
jgi:hypothetical protein